MALSISKIDKTTKDLISCENYNDHLGRNITINFADSHDLYDLKLWVLWKKIPVVLLTGGAVVRMIKVMIRTASLSHLKAIHEFINAEIKDREYREKNTQYAKDLGVLNEI